MFLYRSRGLSSTSIASGVLVVMVGIKARVEILEIVDRGKEAIRILMTVKEIFPRFKSRS